jgi:phosphoribosylformimino-5-aminoimidazole carboxamide ribotide isomerase
VRIIPAIDLKSGRCVRLSEGRAETAKIYELEPLQVARAYQRVGAELIHVVDLDGAFLGAASENREIIRAIANNIDIPIEVGGGVRSMLDIRTMIRAIGARYVILGTVALEQPEIVRQAVAEFGDSVVIGLDARGRELAKRGWTEQSQIDLFDLADHMAGCGVQRIIYTDIARDGLLRGPNLELTRELARRSGLRVTASGGVSSLEDIVNLCELESDGVDSVIVGKALYEGRFTLEEALAAGMAR